MTLRKLIDLLCVIPADCLDLPVFIAADGISEDCRVIEVDPPENGEGNLPSITLSGRLEGMSPPGALLIETRRLPGSV